MKNILDYKLLETNNFSITFLNVIVLIIAAIIVFLFLKLFRKLIKHKIQDKKLDEGRTYSFFTFFKYLIWVSFSLIVLDSIGFKLSLLFAGSAALLVGVGIGLQKIFKDVISGILILFEGSIKLGEIIEIDGQVGRIESIKMRTSKMLTRDNIMLIIPNSRFIENEVINWSETDKKTRFYVQVGVSYSSDIKTVKNILFDTAVNHPNIFKNPEPFVRLSDFGDSALIFRIYFWTDNNFFIENIKSDLRFAIIKEFSANDITIPFPQRDVNIKEN